jgi:hypothetical protein
MVKHSEMMKELEQVSACQLDAEQAATEIAATPEKIFARIAAVTAATKSPTTIVWDSLSSTASDPDWGVKDRQRAIDRVEKARLKALRHRDERAKWRR